MNRSQLCLADLKLKAQLKNNEITLTEFKEKMKVLSNKWIALEKEDQQNSQLQNILKKYKNKKR